MLSPFPHCLFTELSYCCSNGTLNYVVPDKMHHSELSILYSHIKTQLYGHMLLLLPQVIHHLIREPAGATAVCAVPGTCFRILWSVQSFKPHCLSLLPQWHQLLQIWMKTAHSGRHLLCWVLHQSDWKQPLLFSLQVKSRQLKTV